jgi:hypothetical protein
LGMGVRLAGSRRGKEEMSMLTKRVPYARA